MALQPDDIRHRLNKRGTRRERSRSRERDEPWYRHRTRSPIDCDSSACGYSPCVCRMQLCKYAFEKRECLKGDKCRYAHTSNEQAAAKRKDGYYYGLEDKLANTHEKLDETTKELRETKTELGETTAKLNLFKEKYAELLSKATEIIDKKKGQISIYETRISELETELNVTKTEMSTLKTALDDERIANTGLSTASVANHNSIIEYQQKLCSLQCYYDNLYQCYQQMMYGMGCSIKN